MAYRLTPKHRAELRGMTSTQLRTVVSLFSKMAAHPLRLEGEPGRLAAVAAGAKQVLRERVGA